PRSERGCRIDLTVVAADTVVVCDGQLLGKPKSLEDAASMLRLLAGRQHQVLTAVAIADRQHLETVCVSTSVSFRQLGDEEVFAYWHSGEPQDKAGAYAIQGLGALFVSRIEGSYSNVVGLPLYETVQLLAAFGLDSVTLLGEASLCVSRF